MEQDNPLSSTNFNISFGEYEDHLTYFLESNGDDLKITLSSKFAARFHIFIDILVAPNTRAPFFQDSFFVFPGKL